MKTIRVKVAENGIAPRSLRGVVFNPPYLYR
jgi:hypothetical protein